MKIIDVKGVICWLLISIEFSFCHINHRNLACDHQGPSPEPIDIVTSKLRNVTSPPLVLFANLLNTIRLVNTGKSVDAVIADPATTMIATQSVLGSELYIFNSFRFFWTDNPSKAVGSTIDGKLGTPLEIGIYLYNLRYPSFDVAKEHCDGVLQLRYNIVVGGVTNLLFVPMEKALQKIHKAGSSVKVALLEMLWFNLIPFFDQANIAYPGSYFDPVTGQDYTCVTIRKQYLPVQHRISLSQFKKTFLGFKTHEGSPLVTGGETYPSYNRTMVRGTPGLLEIISFFYVPVKPSKI